MKKHEADKLISVIRELAEDKPDVPAHGMPARPASGKSDAPADGDGLGRLTAEEIEKLYQAFKRRFIDDARLDPVLLHLITTRPEIVVEVEPRVVTLDGSTMKGRIARLIAGGWFKTERATGAVRSELARTGADPGGGGTLSDTLSGLQRDGFLEKTPGGRWAAAVGVKVSERQLEAV